MWSYRAAYDVEGVGRMTAPVAYSLVSAVFERHVSALHWVHRGSQHLHPLHVDVLSLHVQRTHIHRAWHIHQCAYRGGGNAMLSCTCFGNDAFLAHLLGKENLSQRIVYLMCPRVVKVFTLQV